MCRKVLHGNSGNSLTELSVSNSELNGAVTGTVEAKYPHIKYSPEEIFSNKVPLLDINFIKPSSTDTWNSAHVLQKTIAGWYVALRTLALVGMLSVLVYIGIKILISSMAADKAKYKMMLKDWLVGMCILVFLHYIMYFILLVGEKLTEIIGGSDTNNILIKVSGGENFTTNITGLTRFLVQYKDIWSKLIYLAMYAAMTWYTIRFTWMYLKRVASMAFLTIIAPLIAFMYPIDKMGGAAQGFNSLMKQFTLNALVQPFHKLIFTVLVTSAMTLVSANPLYAIVVLAFITKAMDMVFNEFLPFGKGGAFGIGAIAGAASGASKSSSKSSSSSSSSSKDKVRTKPGADDRSGKDIVPKGKDSEETPHEEETPKTEEEKAQETEEKKKEEQIQKDKEIAAAEAARKAEEETLHKTAEEARQAEEQEEQDRIAKEKQDEEKEAINRDAEEQDTKAFKRPSKSNKKEKYKAFSSGNKTKKHGIRGAISTIPGVAYKGARGAAKIAAGVALGGGLALAKGGIRFAKAAATGDTHAIQRGLEGIRDGAITGSRFGSKAFDKTVGRAGDATLGRVTGGNRTLAEQYRRHAYNSTTEYKNAASDKAFMKDAEVDEYMRTYYSKEQGYSAADRKQIKKDFVDYRQSTGVTDKDVIRKSLAAEKSYRDKGASPEEARAMGQNAAALASKSKVSSKAWTDDKVYKKEVQNIKETLGNVKNKDAVAEEIMKTLKSMNYK